MCNEASQPVCLLNHLPIIPTHPLMPSLPPPLPPHLSPRFSVSLSSEADVGQRVWSLSGAAESFRPISAIVPELRATLSRLPEDNNLRQLTWRALEDAPATGE
ncbi:hypothetical protein XENORESO_001981 [Xenotaenia resolanae]|uniref:Uncharacterized protein n=1 Tax=Xenotaenia resolanae TaxID=208358 RepID=A0ABV0W667_9TELE